MARLELLLPLHDAARIKTLLDHAAEAATGDDRTRDQIRADTLIDLILNDTDTHLREWLTANTRPTNNDNDNDNYSGDHERNETNQPHPPPDRPSAQPPNSFSHQRSDRSTDRPGGRGGWDARRCPWQITVLIPLSTLLGCTDPGYLDGLGPISADLARDLARDGDWRCAAVDDAHGTILALGRKTYRPGYVAGDALRNLNEATWTRCAFPGCRTRATLCDFDHVTPFTRGGPTCSCNGQPLCRRHHQLKTLRLFQATTNTPTTTTHPAPSPGPPPPGYATPTPHPLPPQHPHPSRSPTPPPIQPTPTTSPTTPPHASTPAPPPLPPPPHLATGATYRPKQRHRPNNGAKKPAATRTPKQPVGRRNASPATQPKPSGKKPNDSDHPHRSDHAVASARRLRFRCPDRGRQQAVNVSDRVDKLDRPDTPGARLPSRAQQVGRQARRLARLVIHGDVALGYAALVLAVFVWVEAGSHSVLVEQASTNLANLQVHPIQVLVTSAFVLAEPSDLLLLPVLIVAYAFAQHRFGRVPTLVTIVIGHVFATLSVATMLVTGIYHRLLQPSVATAVDVGYSYGLACVTGLLLAAVPHRLRVPYILVLVAAWSWPIILGPRLAQLIHPTFTDLGHTIALITGLALSSLARSRLTAP
jgi:hypothetical protein